MKRRYFLNSADTPFDCHCHILPGLDDGSTSLEESLYLAGRLVAYGFRRAVCTSHSTSKYRNSPGTVIPACERLQEALDKEGIPLELVPSLEYRLIPETWPEQRHMGLLPWEGNDPCNGLSHGRHQVDGLYWDRKRASDNDGAQY